MEYIPDPIELMNSRIEKMIEEYIPGHCMVCGLNVGEENLLPYTSRPDAPAACFKCCNPNQKLDQMGLK